MKTTKEVLTNAASVRRIAAALSAESKNAALLAMASALEENAEKILAANVDDVENARGIISDVMLDRLSLNKARISDMASGVRAVAELPDPVGNLLSSKIRNGMEIRKVSVPIGVIAIIYESRPNVTSDAAALALKSGNVCVLRGGKEAYLTNAAITAALRDGLVSCGISESCINLIEDTSRESAAELMGAVGFVDLLIPRGGAGLINACVQNAKVPCIQTGTGICHIYVDREADFDMALNIIENAKTSRPSVCNAAEVCLVDCEIASTFLPLLAKRLDRVELRLDNKSAQIISGTAASNTDFDTEFLDYTMAVAVVDGVYGAINHIAAHSTGHSEAIITKNPATAKVFTDAVDSAAVYVNASTRFTDGGEFGLGCEMGISTQKVHARGPIGLRELTSYKYVILGSGQTR